MPAQMRALDVEILAARHAGIAGAFLALAAFAFSAESGRSHECRCWHSGVGHCLASFDSARSRANPP